MAVVKQNAFRVKPTGYDEVPQQEYLLFKRRTYFTATFYF